MLKGAEKPGKYINVSLAVAKDKRAKGDKRKEELLTNGKERYRNGRVVEEEKTDQ